MEAKALLRLGQCYEKLGEAEAAKAYERVVREYGDHGTEAEAARARLAAMKPPVAKSMAARRLLEVPDITSPFGFTVSPDGRYLMADNRLPGQEANIHDLHTGQIRAMPYPCKDYVWSPVISEDGKSVAYGCTELGHSNEIHLGRLDAPDHRLLLRSPEMRHINLLGFFPDNRRLLTFFRPYDETWELAEVALSDGARKSLKKFGKIHPGWHTRVSPDGQLIAYDIPVAEGSTNRDIFLLPLDGSPEIRVTDHAASDVVMGWTADGRGLLFLSNRTGTQDLWLLPIRNRKPDTPQLLQKSLGPVRALAVDRKGALPYHIATDFGNLQLVKLDQDGRMEFPPQPFGDRLPGRNTAPAFSADGMYLSYVSTRSSAEGGQQQVLCIRALDSGKQDEYRLDLTGVWMMRWSPDGKSIVLVGQTGYVGSVRRRLYLFDINSGTLKVMSTSGGPETNTWSAWWLPDGRSILFYDVNITDGTQRIGVRGN